MERCKKKSELYSRYPGSTTLKKICFFLFLSYTILSIDNNIHKILENQKQGELEMKKIAMLLVLCFLTSAAIFAFEGYIDVTNDTGFTIYYLVVSHENQDTWPDFYEEDLLEDYGVLSDGETFTIWLDGKYPSAIFDIRAEDEDGDTYAVYGIDAEYEDCIITLSDLE